MNKRKFKQKRYQKKRYRDTKQNAYNQLYKEVKRQVNNANQRLNTLERHGIKKGTWASKRLKSKLNTKLLKAYSKSGRIKINPNMSTTQLIAIQKAVRNFLNSKTSTIKGIEEVKQNTIDSLYQDFDLEGSELTRNDYANIYDLFEEKDFSDLSNYLDPSDVITLMVDCIDYNWDENTFLSKLTDLQISNDVDISTKAKSLYQKLKQLKR